MSGVLVAGIGNVLNGDDGFGVEVARRMKTRPQPDGVTVADFGVRGLDLIYALLGDYDAAILIDAAALGRAPGTLSLLEPERREEPEPEKLLIAADELDPANMLRIVSALEGGCGRIILLACEPVRPGGQGSHPGLSKLVAEAVDPAVATAEQWIHGFLHEGDKAAHA